METVVLWEAATTPRVFLLKRRSSEEGLLCWGLGLQTVFNDGFWNVPTATAWMEQACVTPTEQNKQEANRKKPLSPPAWSPPCPLLKEPSQEQLAKQKCSLQSARGGWAWSVVNWHSRPELRKPLSTCFLSPR